MIIDVVNFNKKRNKLAWNDVLEIKMLDEEIREFWDATTVAERVDAYIDTQYVWIGTRVKASYNSVAINIDVRNTINQTLELMEDYLKEELGKHYDTVIANAKKIVCSANELKGSKLNEDGKVIKDEKYRAAIDATKSIALMIEEVTKPKSY